MSGIKIEGLTKRYGDTVALNDVQLTLQPGKIYGLLGRNGAGKTTLLNVLTGRIFADAGQVSLDGGPIVENDVALGQISMQSEQTLYPERMRVNQALKWAAVFYPSFDLEEAKALTLRFGLDPNKRVNALSTGYKTIFKLIVSLCTRAPYIFLDEPVLGLDANHRELFYKVLMEQYAKHQSCFVVSTHLVEEVSGLVEDVIIIKQGQIIRNEPRESLLAQGYTVSGTAAVVDAYIAGRDVLGTDALGGLKTAHLLGQPPQTPPEGLEISRLDLQRLFVQLTN